MKTQTPMQGLLRDLKETKITTFNALNDIRDEHTKKCCRIIVETTLNCIIERIETELLPKEQQVIEESWIDGKENIVLGDNIFDDAKQYYNTKFK